ncbi:MAG TPA: hypothetical protein VNT79_08590, partial [Phycisphaerae bacterium]|nr:hypothetical protein [Phycisphaerae bacterium]
VAPRTGVKHTVVFHSAEFDRPNHSLDMTPDIWNLPAGVIVDSRFDPATGLVESGDGRYLGGGVVISEDDWNQVKNQYDYSALQAFWERNSEIGSGPYPKWWAAAGADFGLSAASANPDLWEAYVRRWILRHTPLHPSAGEEATQPLSDEQVTAAWGILKDCRRRAKPILRRMQEQDEAKNAGANAERTDAGGQQELSAPTSAPSGEKTATLRKSPRELTKVPTRYEREINTVFELLKKRLAELLRENQRLYDDKPKVAASVAPSS